MTVTTEDEFGAGHTNERPSWDCASCGQSWPCANAKGSLLQEFRGYPSVLAVYMSAQLCEAMLDLTAHGADPPTDLYERFLSWIHHAAAKPRSVNGFPHSGDLQRRRRRQAV